MKWRFVHLPRLMCHQDGRPHVQSRHPSAAGRGRQSQPGTSGPSWWGAAELIWPRGSSWRSSGRAGRLVWTRLRQRKKEEEESCLISWGPQCGGPVVRAGGSAATWCDCCSPPSCSYVPGFIHWSLKRIFLQLVGVNDPTQITPVANQKVGGSIPTSRIVLGWWYLVENSKSEEQLPVLTEVSTCSRCQTSEPVYGNVQVQPELRSWILCCHTFKCFCFINKTIFL